MQINRHPLTNVTVQGSWRTIRLRIDGGLLLEERNWLRIIWPEISISGEEALEKAATAMENESTPELFPVYGEIQALRLIGVA